MTRFAVSVILLSYCGISWIACKLLSGIARVFLFSAYIIASAAIRVEVTTGTLVRRFNKP